MMTETMIEKLTAKGFSRWTKGAMDRLYINANDLGLYTDHYKSGNICYASFNGEEISHAHALRMLGAKIWIDVETGMLNSKYAEDCLVESAEALYAQVKAEIAAEEAAAEESDVKEDTAEDTPTTESSTATCLSMPTIERKQKRMIWSEGWHEVDSNFSYYVESGKLMHGNSMGEHLTPYKKNPNGGYDNARGIAANKRNYDRIYWF